jgi:hypothetical protein
MWEFHFSDSPGSEAIQFEQLLCVLRLTNISLIETLLT